MVSRHGVVTEGAWEGCKHTQGTFMYTIQTSDILRCVLPNSREEPRRSRRTSNELTIDIIRRIGYRDQTQRARTKLCCEGNDFEDPTIGH